MGGMGSGPQGGRTLTLEAVTRLDIGWMFRTGRILAGHEVSGVIHWERTSDQTRIGSVAFRSVLSGGDTQNRIELRGMIRNAPYMQTIELVSRPARFGGQVWFAICPASGRRCRKLVLCQRRLVFVSQPASGLPYASSISGEIGRAHARIERAERKLAGLSRYARKATVLRLTEEYHDAEDALLIDVMAGIMNWRARLDGF